MKIMKSETLKKSVSAILAVAALSVSGLSQAQAAKGNVNGGGLPANPHRLEDILKAERQPVQKLDRSGLRLVLNDRMKGVTLEGWGTRALSDKQAGQLFDQFGIRVVKDPASGHASYLAPTTVGRAGILEGDIYMKLNGKVYKGLTLKGYGGNVTPNNRGNYRGEQPEGSLSFEESIRDMEVSTILAENHVSTYVGVLSVERPDPKTPGTAYSKANYVRLSRTALRMEDLIVVKDDQLARLVDYMTDLMKDEMGKKLTTSEFTRWLAQETGDLMARKDYIRFAHASITESNIGIGELVDLGDLSSWNKVGMVVPGSYQSQNAQFKQIAAAAIENLKTLDTLVTLDFDQVYDQAYNARLQELSAFDQARVNLNNATVAELAKIGFTAEEAREVVKYNRNTPDGIIDPSEIAGLKAMTKNVKKILARTTTNFMRLADGSQLATYYVRNVGGAAGVRGVIEKTREFMKSNSISLSRDASGQIVASVAGDLERLEVEIQRLALEQAKAAGSTRAVMAEGVTNFSKFIARQILEVIVRR